MARFEKIMDFPVPCGDDNRVFCPFLMSCIMSNCWLVYIIMSIFCGTGLLSV